MWSKQAKDITRQTVEEDAARQATGMPSPAENGASSAFLPDSVRLYTCMPCESTHERSFY